VRFKPYPRYIASSCKAAIKINGALDYQGLVTEYNTAIQETVKAKGG
jgi:hypothetical protein